MTRLDPVHPGEVLKRDFMEPHALSSTALARALGVTPARINEIVRGRRGITADTALRRRLSAPLESQDCNPAIHNFATVAATDRGQEDLVNGAARYSRM